MCEFLRLTPAHVITYLLIESTLIHSPLSPSPSSKFTALAQRLGYSSPDEDPHFLPLQAAVTHGRVYLLSLVGPGEDLGRPLAYGSILLDSVAMGGEVCLGEALVQRGVDFDLRNKGGFTPLATAIKWSRMAFVRFLFAQYRARVQDEQEVLHGLIDRPPLDNDGITYPLIFCLINQEAPRTLTILDEDKRAMVALLVQEGGADIWEELRIHADAFLPLHAPRHHGRPNCR